MPKHFDAVAARRGVMSKMPKTSELKAFFDVIGPTELDDIRGSNSAARRLDPAIKLESGKVIQGKAGVDTHVGLERKHGVGQTGSTKRTKTTGFVDKKTGKFIGRAKAFLKFGIGDSFQLFDPRKLAGKTFGPGFLGGLVAPQIFDMVNGGPLFGQKRHAVPPLGAGSET